MEGFANSEQVLTSKVEISEQEFRSFHSIDRRLYLILVADLLRDPIEAMQIMALWLWLERAGFFNIVRKVLELPSILINEMADEAVICLRYVNSLLNTPLSTYEITSIDHFSLTQNLIQNDFSIQYLVQNQTIAKAGLEKVQIDVCMRAFGDLMREAVVIQNTAQWIAERQQLQLQQQTIMSSRRDPGVIIPAEERTMFVTFSIGYPVVEHEIRDFFAATFGNCIESLYMQDQALFAKIVFVRADTIHQILNGEFKAKFTINGKHVWMRRYFPKQRRTTLVNMQSHNQQNDVGHRSN